VVSRTASRSVAVVAIAARLRGSRFVYSSANVVDFELERLDRPFNVRLFERAARAAAEVVVQTDEQAELCRRRLGRDPVVIRSAVESTPPRSGSPEAFLWIGRMAPYKRLDVYLGLAAAVPEARFLAIAVPGHSEEPQVRERLERARRELPNLDVLDPRPRSELGAVIERAVAIVNTSEHEGMPNIFLEGWSRGVPAIAFSVDPDGIVAREGLGGFAEGSEACLADLTRAMWAARSDQRDLAERCRAYVSHHHDVEAVGAAWRRVLSMAGNR
jgi:glycosyltransferase involved in cell wall biosynthesis